jgi:ankyrin repeat protein
MENENKKRGIGRAFRKMFADTEVEKAKATMVKSRDALKLISAIFRMLLGNEQAEFPAEAGGLGYAGLAAALERLNLLKTDPLEVLQEDSMARMCARSRTPFGMRHDEEQLHHSFFRGITPTPTDSCFEHRGLSQGIIELHKNWQPPTAPSTCSDASAPSIRSDVTPYSPHDTVISEGTKSRTYTDVDMHHLSRSTSEQYSVEASHRKSDESSLEQLQPRFRSSPMLEGGKGVLVEAVQHKRHKVLKLLFDGGAKADAKLEAFMLRLAVKNRDAESISILLRFGANANGIDQNGWCPLYVATQVSYFGGAQLLLKSGADPNLCAGPDSESSLCLAACGNQIDLVQIYLAHEGDAESIMENGNSTLIQCMNKTVSPRLVEMLIKSGIDPNHKNCEGATALFRAIHANRVDLMTVLLDNGANPNLPAPKHPLWPSVYKPKALQLLLDRGADQTKTPGIMELAASVKNLETIKILMKAGVSPNVRIDGVYTTPLCSAIRDSSDDIVKYLLEHGADPNLRAAEYPVFKCITHNRPQFLPQLVAAGADLNLPKGIIEAAVAHKNQEALEFLINQNANINDTSTEGNTALTTAIREDRIDFVELLLANGADPIIRGALCLAVKRPDILKRLLAATQNPGAIRGVVEVACAANQIESVKMLLAAGVSVEDTNCGVYSPLTTSIREHQKPIVRYLLDGAHADPDAPGEHLPLVMALRGLLPGDTEILTMLLTRGADINKMHRGWNAVLQAVENGDPDILRLLIEKGGSVDLQAIDESGRPVIDIVTERGWEEGLALILPNAQDSAIDG